METQFKHLALGARFSLLCYSSQIFVKLSETTCVEFNKNETITCFNKPKVNEIHPNWNVMARDSYGYGYTYHCFPKTAYQEGYDAYCLSPLSCNNPYPKNSQAWKDYHEGYSDADWDDCE